MAEGCGFQDRDVFAQPPILGLQTTDLSVFLAGRATAFEGYSPRCSQTSRAVRSRSAGSTFFAMTTSNQLKRTRHKTEDGSGVRIPSDPLVKASLTRGFFSSRGFARIHGLYRAVTLDMTIVSDGLVLFPELAAVGERQLSRRATLSCR